MRRKCDPLVQYDALSARITRSGEVCLYHIRLDVGTGHLVTTTLDSWILEPEGTRRPLNLLETAVDSYRHRVNRQGRLFD